MNNQSDDDAPLSQQELDWGELYERIAGYLKPLGTESPIGKGDYWLLDENWGQRLHRIEVQNLNFLAPSVVGELQLLLSDYPDWEIAMAVDVPGTERQWPGMGLVISKDGIVDELRREFLPKPIRDFRYEPVR